MYNVLIVEDDLMVCAILERQIGRFQQLNIAGSFHRGTEALEWIFENPGAADLVILDYFMPNMTGIELLKKLREFDNNIQVIMITSANDYEIIRSAVCCGICDYVLKPFSSARLEKAVSKFETVMKLKAETHVWTQDKVDVLLCPHKHYITEPSDKDAGPKGGKINATTLANVREYMNSIKGVKMPLTEISEGIGLSTVTMRRYLKHLNSLGEVNITLDCKTGGRPSEIFEYVGERESK